jgi:iron complex transport system substrate-binding protein
MSEVRTIKDSLSRTVAVPAKPERILSLQPEITRILVSLGAGGRLVGIDFFLRRYDHLFKILFPAQSRLPLISTADDNVNVEVVIKQHPDLIFASPSEKRIPELLQQKSGKPVVALSAMGSLSRLSAEITLVGDLVNERERAAELVAYLEANLARARDVASRLPSSRRPKVYLSFWGTLTRTPVSYEPVDAAGGINLADKLLPSFLGTLSALIPLEQIIRWDPDIILIQGSYVPRERKVTTESALGDARLASVRAVRNKQVFYTFGFWHWWDPALVLVETLYLAKLFHPEEFAGFDLEKEGNAIFEKFYGREDAFSELCRVLNCHEWISR